MFWHRHIFSVIAYLSLYHRHTKMTALVSGSEDGRLLQTLLKAFGFDIVEGSSSSEGYASLLKLHRISHEEGLILITPDGPKGPPTKIKPGALHISAFSRNPLVCIHVSYGSFWQLKSWDRACLPKPFSSCVITISELVSSVPSSMNLENETFVHNLELNLDGHQTDRRVESALS